MGSCCTILQAGYHIFAADIANDKAGAAVIIRAGNQRGGIGAHDLLRPGVGHALHFPVGGGNPGGGAELIRASRQSGFRILRCSHLCAGLDSLGAGQRKPVDRRLRRDGGLELLAEDLSQNIHHRLAFHGKLRGAIPGLGLVADLGIITSHGDIVPHDDLVCVHIAGHCDPRSAVISIGSLLKISLIYRGSHHEHITLLGHGCMLFGEERLDHTGVGSVGVSLGALIKRTADLRKFLLIRLLGSRSRGLYITKRCELLFVVSHIAFLLSSFFEDFFQHIGCIIWRRNLIGRHLCIRRNRSIFGNINTFADPHGAKLVLACYR